MTARATIRPEQIARAKKLLQDLPEKDDRKTRPEAARLLENDFRKAMKKGYCPKEICALLKNEGILIPARLIKNPGADSDETSRPKAKEKQTPEQSSSVPSDAPDAEV